MAGFLYYTPGQRPPSREHLASIDFPHCHEAGSHGDSPGPDGGRGNIFTLKATHVPGARQPDPSFDPQSVNEDAATSQEWHECADGAWWLGWNVNDRPRPVDLARRASLTGFDVPLSDGTVWRIPQVRGSDGFPAVGCVLDITPQGRIVANRPAPQYQRLWDALLAACAKAGAGANIFQDNDTIRLICDVMAWNYRVSVWELLKLGTLTTENFAPLFAKMTGLE